MLCRRPPAPVRGRALITALTPNGRAVSGLLGRFLFRETDRHLIHAIQIHNIHFQEYQTVWNGDGGRVFFYQCELPYDAPSQAAWEHNGVAGYAAYKIADTVKSHSA